MARKTKHSNMAVVQLYVSMVVIKMRGEQRSQTRVSPGQRFQFREKFAISQKVLPAWASLGPPEMRGERESGHRGGCEAISVGHFYLISPLYFNE